MLGFLNLFIYLLAFQLKNVSFLAGFQLARQFLILKISFYHAKQAL